MAYGIQIMVEQPHAVVVDRVQAALKAEGLIVLTVTDVADTLDQAFEMKIPPQVALGICTASLARASLEADPSVGLLVPCSIIVRAAPAGSATIVEAPKLSMIVAITGDHSLEPAVADAGNRLRAALARLDETDLPDQKYRPHTPD